MATGVFPIGDTYLTLLSLLAIMKQIGQSDSVVFQNDQNQFLLEYLQYESCPFCSRSFFRGKLAYHLKHCSNENPMSKSNKTSPRQFKSSLSAATNYERCANCNSRIPSYMLAKHSQSCLKVAEAKTKKSNETKQSLKNNETSVEETIFPKIRSHISHDHTKTSKRIIINTSGPKAIKIRQQLRCLRIAEQVQKIQCQYCGRRFSEQASLRHIPICSVLKEKQINKNFFCKNQGKKERTRLEGFAKSYELTAFKPVARNKSQSNTTVLPSKQQADEEQGERIANPERVEKEERAEDGKVEQK